MLSALVLVDRAVLPSDDAHRARVIVRTLAALVTLVVEDVVADATLVTRADPALAGIDEGAGCTVAEDATLGQAFARALAGARRPHALILRAGFAPDGGTGPELIERLGADEHDAFLLRIHADTFFQRLFPAAAPAVGLVAPMAALRSVTIGEGDLLRQLTRSVRTAPMRSRAIPLA